MQRRPTMNDVAARAQVALKTVSRYVNGETNIRADLAERIRVAIEDLGYRRNLVAASMRPGWTSRMIGLIISDLANPYYSTLARAIESVVVPAGYMLTTMSSDEDGDRHDRFVDRLMQQQVSALIVVPPRCPSRLWRDVAPPLPPLVFLDRPANYQQADTILADNLGGAQNATEALIDSGASRVAFVGDSLTLYTMQQRHAGYIQALEARGLSAEADLLFTEAHSSEQATTIVANLVRSSAADAIFAANNRASIGALLAFRQTGCRLPIIGFDDFEAAPLASPPVSVVSQDIALMGRTAANIALARIDGDTSSHHAHVLSTQLVLRGSERATTNAGSAEAVPADAALPIRP